MILPESIWIKSYDSEKKEKKDDGFKQFLINNVSWIMSYKAQIYLYFNKQLVKR